MLVHYQTVHRLDDCTSTGAEALVRWNHPSRGVLSPDLFIPLAESSGAIVELGQLVLALSLQQLADWQALPAAKNWRINVNLSARQLTTPGLVDMVRSELKNAKVDPTSLTLELTETYRMYDLEQAAQVLSELRETGVRVALDDFGIGNTTFSHLRKFKVDELKIDRSLVSTLHENSPDGIMVRAITEMGASLGIDVVVEGIEHEFQRFAALEMGATHGQGWYFSQAVLGPNVSVDPAA